MNFLLGLFGIKVPAWLVDTVLVVVVALGAYGYILHKGKREELATLQASSIELTSKTIAENKATSEAYAAQAAANREKLNVATASQNAAVDVLAQRVRDFDAYRSAHPEVASAAGNGGAAPVGECGDRPCGEVAVQLAEGGNDLARALAGVVPALQACQRDRDALTGLPK